VCELPKDGRNVPKDVRVVKGCTIVRVMHLFGFINEHLDSQVWWLSVNI
jgi:hypothetical protein